MTCTSIVSVIPGGTGHGNEGISISGIPKKSNSSPKRKSKGSGGGNGIGGNPGIIIGGIGGNRSNMFSENGHGNEGISKGNGKPKASNSSPIRKSKGSGGGNGIGGNPGIIIGGIGGNRSNMFSENGHGNEGISKGNGKPKAPNSSPRRKSKGSGGGNGIGTSRGNVTLKGILNNSKPAASTVNVTTNVDNSTPYHRCSRLDN